MNPKVLVTYATRCGSTAEIAQAVADELANRGFAVDIRPVQQVNQVDKYGAVVIGSAVRFGQVLPEAVKFIEQNHIQLNEMPTAIFAVHIMNMGNDETDRQARQAYLDPARNLIAPQSEAFFTGVGDPQKVSFIERLLAKAVKSPEGDFRDWDAIRGWAKNLNLV